jgi:hypothetical protein
MAGLSVREWPPNKALKLTSLTLPGGFGLQLNAGWSQLNDATSRR